MAIPHLKQQGDKKLLVVNDNPILLLAGEVHNSNSSSDKYMLPIWQKAQTLDLNCLLLPVSWEMIEPQEERMDFTIVDQLITRAREYKMKIVFLWFGSWKNAECMYAPSWVKCDMNRFPRAQIVKGENKSLLPGPHPRPYTSLSYFGEETQKADSRAFASLMAHIRSIDEYEQTVVAVQVENETGLLGSARERSDFADKAFAQQVPKDFALYMKEHAREMPKEKATAVLSGAQAGSWQQVFGDCAEEIFSAYHFASAVEQVAKAGKEQYALPMMVNCWLDKPTDKAGDYPSGGPIAAMMPVWKYCAPSVDVYCPDIYVPYFCDVCETYTQNGNPLFIPEAATHSYAGVRQVYVIGHHHALGYSPFGFEDIGEPFTLLQGVLFGMDVSDPALKTPQSVEEYACFNKYLKQLMPLITERIGTTALQAVSSERPNENILKFGKFIVKAITDHPMQKGKPGVCMGIKLSENECLLLAKGCVIRLMSNDDDCPNIDILDLEEGYIENGRWNMTRRLNGDEATLMNFDDITLLRLKVHTYK